MNSAGLKIYFVASMVERIHKPFWELKPTRHAQRYPVQYEFNIAEQSWTTYSTLDIGSTVLYIWSGVSGIVGIDDGINEEGYEAVLGISGGSNDIGEEGLKGGMDGTKLWSNMLLGGCYEVNWHIPLTS